MAQADNIIKKLYRIRWP